MKLRTREWNVFLLAAIPLVRAASIYYSCGEFIYKDYIVYFSLLQIVPELLTFFNDSSSSVNRATILYYARFIGLAVSWVIISAIVLSFWLGSRYGPYELTTLILLAYTLQDSLLIIDTPNRSTTSNMWLNSTRIAVIILIILGANLLIPIFSTAVFYAFSHSEKLKKHNVSGKIFYAHVINSVVAILFSRGRDYCLHKLVQSVLNGEIYFYSNILQRLLSWLAGLNYTLLRNDAIWLGVLQKSYKKIFLTASTSIVLITLFLTGIPRQELLLLALFLTIFSETLLCQLCIFSGKSVVKELQLVNFFGLFLYLTIPNYILPAAKIFYFDSSPLFWALFSPIFSIYIFFRFLGRKNDKSSCGFL